MRGDPFSLLPPLPSLPSPSLPSPSPLTLPSPFSLLPQSLISLSPYPSSYVIQRLEERHVYIDITDVGRNSTE